jgi:hypothetical protein
MDIPINERFNWIDLSINPLNIGKDSSIIPESYYTLLQFSNGATINFATIDINVKGVIVTEAISRFMSYEELITNDYLEIKLKFFEDDLEVSECIKLLCERFCVFCSSDIGNTMFAFDKFEESFGNVYYLDLDNFPYLAYKIFENFEEFLDNIVVDSN